MRRVVLALAALLVSAASAAAGGSASFPKRIARRRLAAGGNRDAGEQFYVGSIPTGAVYRGNLRTGRGSVLVRPRQGRAAIGIEADRGRLFVAGGSTGKAFVYDARTGASLAALQLAAGGGDTFVNDVAVTRRSAWFTDSSRDVLYRVPLSASGRPGAQAPSRRSRSRATSSSRRGSTRTASTSTERGS